MFGNSAPTPEPVPGSRLLLLVIGLAVFTVLVVNGLASIGEPQSVWLKGLFGGH